MKNNAKQIANAIKRAENLRDDGRYGRAFEILCSRALSKKNEVARQNEADCRVKCEVNGKIVYRSAECKTNGGRIEKLINALENGKDTLFIYRLDVCNSSTQNMRRYIPARIGYFSDFLEMLEECGALKNTNGKNPEVAIQCSSKKLFIALESYGVPFDNEAVYRF